MRLLNRLPDYVLAIQHVQNRETRWCSSFLLGMKEKRYQRFLVVFLQNSESVRVACQYY